MSNMFGRLWGFMKRHRRKFFVTGALVGGAVLLGKYAQSKYKEYQEREAADILSFIKKQHHFESNQRICNTTALSMLPTLRDAIKKSINTEKLTALLKTKPENKIEIWEELKVKSFSRMFVCVYASCILISVLRVRLNIIGGYMYRDSRMHRNGMTVDPAIASTDVQHKYLEGIQHIISEGLKDLTSAVLKATKNVIGSISLKQALSITDLDTIVRKVRQQLEFWPETGYYDGGASSLCRFMTPFSAAEQDTTYVNRDAIIMELLAKETQDVIESADFNSVLTVGLDRSFSQLLDKLAEYYNGQRREDLEQSTEQFESTVLMAKLIPIVNGMLHVILADLPNDFIQELLLLEQGKDFAANVYESFSQEDTCLVVK